MAKKSIAQNNANNKTEIKIDRFYFYSSFLVEINVTISRECKLLAIRSLCL